MKGLKMKLSKIVLGAIVLATNSASAGELIKNENFGFEVTLPDGWEKSTADEYFKNLSKVKTDDPSFQDALVKYASVPLVMAMKHPEPFNDINPSFKLNARPYGQIETRDGGKILEMILPSLQRAFGNMKITSPAESVDVGGKTATHIAVTYTLKTDTGEWPGASELWLIPEPNYLYMLGIGYRPDETTGSRAEVISIIDSLQFADADEQP